MHRGIFNRFWIIIGAAVLLVVLFLLAWFISLETTEKEALEQYNQQQLLLATGIAGSINALFDDLEASLGSLGLLPEIQYFDETNARLALARKQEELSLQGVSDIGILDANGVAKFHSAQRETEGVDLSWRSYFKTARDLDASVVSQSLVVELQILEQGDLGFKIAIPFYETAIDIDHPSPNDDFAGVIVGTLTLETLINRYISPFTPPGGGQIILANNEFDIIWSSDDSLKQANLLAARHTRFNAMVENVNTWTHDSNHGGAYIAQNSSQNNETELIAYAPVRIGLELMAVSIITPSGVARQTSLSTFQTQQFVFIISIVTLLAGIVLGGIVLRRETNRRFMIEEALRKSETEQAILTERNRLAGDLHDSVTQGLYGILLHADAARGQMAVGQMEKASEYLEEIKEAGKEGLAEMRLLIFELRPPVLEEEGLVAALEARLFAVEKRAGLKVDLLSEMDTRLPLNIEEGLYRIAQEALNNTLKHAQAQHIRVCLKRNGKAVTLLIEDDGSGFEVISARMSGGMGLVNMEERAEKLGGRLVIHSEPGQGTRILVEVNP